MTRNDGNSPSTTQQRRLKKKPNLTVDTSNGASNGGDHHEHRSPSTPHGVRGSRDLRSPGMQNSPVAAAGAIPDFITQTDAHGNATTPRSAKAIEGATRAAATKARSRSHRGRKQHEEDASDSSSDASKDAAGEACDTLVDSFRMICCCLAPTGMVQSGATTKSRLSSKETQDSEENIDDAKDSVADDHNRPKLLGAIHPEDTGKKCLVLDLDETLVHSSFRAVEGADFVIPVKVCSGDFSLLWLFAASSKTSLTLSFFRSLEHLFQ